jgi:hypothetical protein
LFVLFVTFFLCSFVAFLSLFVCFFATAFLVSLQEFPVCNNNRKETKEALVMASSQLWSAALNSPVVAASPFSLSTLLPDHHIAAYGCLQQQQQQQEEAEEMYQEEEECVITHIVHGSDAHEPEANFLLRQNCEQEEEQQQENYHERMGFPQTFLVLQDAKEKKNVGVVADLEMEEEEEEEQACVYMVVDYGLQEVEEDCVRFPELESRLVGWKQQQQQQQQQQGYCEEEQEEMASVVLDQEKGRWLLQPKKNGDADAQFAEVAELKPFLQAYMAAKSGGLYSGGVEDDVYNHPSQQQQQQIINNADATAAAAPQERSSSAMELEEDVSLYAQLGMRDGIAIGFEDEAGRHQRGDHARASQEEAEQQEQETCLSVVMQQQQQPSTALSVFHEIVGTTLALEEHSQQIALSVTPLSTRPPPSSAASLEVVEVGKELTLREPSQGGENPCLLTASAMFTGWQNFESIGSSSEPLKQITDGSTSGGGGEEDYEWGHFDPSDWVPFSSSQSKNSPPLLLCGKKGSVTIPYNSKPLKSRMPAQLVNQGRETWKDLTLSGEQSEDAAR